MGIITMPNIILTTYHNLLTSELWILSKSNPSDSHTSRW